MKILEHLIEYAKNYRSRHADNINFTLHVVGIPQAFFGLFQILTGTWKIGLLNFFLGYFWQWIGHKYFEKNEVGEITLIKKILERFKRP